MRVSTALLAAVAMIIAPAALAQTPKITMEEMMVPSGDAGIEIYVRNKRPADMASFRPERTLLYVHGATYPSSTAFDLQLGGMSWMDYIAARGYDVYLLDLRGYGKSTRPKEMSEKPEANPPIVRGDTAVKDISTVVDFILKRRNIPRLDLLGWSWGTTLMATYTTQNAAKVERLVLYAPAWIRTTPSLVQAGPGPVPAYRMVRRDQALGRWMTGVAENKKADLIPAGWFDAWADATWATDPEGGKMDPPVLRAPNGVVQDGLEFFGAGKPYYDPARITVPTLLIHAEWDQDTPSYMAQTLFPLLTNSPGKRYVQLAEGTHSIIMEKNRLGAVQGGAGVPGRGSRIVAVLLKAAASPDAAAWADARPPLLRFLTECHATFALETGGTVASYIPELGKADPDRFGIALATIDGHVYEVGDTRIAFTIQSMSKAFVFALALDTLGAARVESTIGVEPSGEPFNSIRLNADNHPFNPMVNSGAIACSGLIHEAKGDGAFDCIRESLSRFAGRELAVDEAVYASESTTGDRNRAIGYLLRNSGVIRSNVDAVLAVYFRQCAILVTARDIAIMAATLANRGTNPVTGVQVATPYAVARTLSVMTSSGMYDYAGEWIYRVGIPAKSGVAGGILATHPAQFGLGSYSPRLDAHGNSVRGIKVCEALSAHFDLHMLNRSGDARDSIIADYDIGKSASRRSRRPDEQRILAAHTGDVRILELVGALTLANVDYVSRQLAAKPRPQIVIFDLRRVATLTRAAARLLADGFRELAAFDVTAVVSGLERSSALWQALGEWTDGIVNLRDFHLLDDAIEWAEDQLVYRHGGSIDSTELTGLSEQALLAGLTAEEIAALAKLGTVTTYQPGQRIIAAEEPATSLYFLRSGVVHVKLPSGVRLATLSAGMVFGEMSLLETKRSADVLADKSVTVLEVPLADFQRFREAHPRIGERIMRNLAQLLADRLIVANAKVNLLTAE